MKVTTPSLFIIGVSIERVFTWATVELIEQIAKPVVSVKEQSTYVFPLPVDEKVGVVPMIGLLFESRRRIEIVEL